MGVIIRSFLHEVHPMHCWQREAVAVQAGCHLEREEAAIPYRLGREEQELLVVQDRPLRTLSPRVV